MEKLNATLQGLSLEAQVPALMTHSVVGYPSLESTLEVVRGMVEWGSSINRASDTIFGSYG